MPRRGAIPADAVDLGVLLQDLQGRSGLGLRDTLGLEARDAAALCGQGGFGTAKLDGDGLGGLGPALKAEIACAAVRVSSSGHQITVHSAKGSVTAALAPR